MAKRKEIDLEYKVWLVEECLAKRMRGREAARRAEVSSTTMRNWISLYISSGADALAQTEHPSKYSKELKQTIAEEYLTGCSSARAISVKYKIRSPSLVIKWVKEYNRHKELANERREDIMTRKSYTPDFRLKIVNEYLDEEKSINFLSEKYDVDSHVIRTWIQKYKDKGAAGLEDRRGQRLAKQTPRTAEEELRIKYAQMERENYLLRMENALLKKVKELERGQD